jgi:hypothetical protein
MSAPRYKKVGAQSAVPNLGAISEIAVPISFEYDISTGTFLFNGS